MRATISRFVFLALAPLTATLISPAPTVAQTKAPGKIAWAKSYDDAIRLAKAKKTIVMVDFYTDWCGYCKKMDRETFPDKRVIAAMNGVVGVKVNAEREGAALAGQHAISGFPTYLFIQPDGQVMTRIPGFVPAAEFAQAVTAIATDARVIPAAEAALKANPKDTGAASKLAFMYIRQGNVDAASRTATNIVRAAPTEGAHSRLYFVLGSAYFRQQRYRDSITWFDAMTKAAKSASETSLAHLSLGVAHKMNGDTSRARAALQKVVQTPGAPKDMVDEARRRLDSMK